MNIQSAKLKPLRFLICCFVTFALLIALIPKRTMSASESNSKIPTISFLTHRINGVETETFENGNLSTSITVSNDGFSGNVICFVAVYDNNILNRVNMKGHTFADTEKSWKLKIDSGYVTAKQNAKVFLWNGASLIPYTDVKQLAKSPGTTQVYTNATFDGYTTLIAKYNGKGNILEKGRDESGEDCCVFKRTISSDFHLDVHVFPYESKKVVYQYDVKIKTPNLTCYNNLITKDGTQITPHSIESGYLKAGNASVGLVLNKWYTVSTVFDTETNTADIFLDYFIFSKDVKCSSDYSHKDTNMWRFHVPIGTSDTEFYVDNVSIYKSNKVQDMKNHPACTYNELPITEKNDSDIYIRPDQHEIRSSYSVSSLEGKHPRVILSKKDFDRIRYDVKNNSTAKFYYNYVIPRADALLSDTDPLVYELSDGVRLLDVSYKMIDHMMLLGLAYQVTGKEEYADRAWMDLESVSAFPGWHPEHPLDVGAMAVGYAIGYDWMYDAFSDEQKKTIEEGALKNGFNIMIEGYQGRHAPMVSSIIEKGNHCMVMNSGATLLGLAFFDVYPEVSAYSISAATRCLETGINCFTPDGEWFEGMGYTGMTVEYLTYQLSALKKVFGTCYGLDKTPGIDKINEFYLYMQSPQGAFAYSDGASQNVHFDAGLLWLAENFNDYDELTAYNNLYAFYPGVRVVMWFDESKLMSESRLTLDKRYDGQYVFTMRDSWIKSEQTTFAAIKGRSPDLGHGHLDSGTFAFFANGVRWTYEYGKEDYNLPGYWNGENRTSPRWQYFRLRAEGHNCLIINPDQYGEFDPQSTSPIVETKSGENGAIAIVDMTDAYMGKAKSARRGAFLTDKRKSLVIRDEVVLNNESTLYWFMQTDQEAVLTSDSKGIILKQKNNPSNYVTLTFVCSHDYELSIKPAIPLLTSPRPDGMADDSNIKRIELKCDAKDEFSLTAKLTPNTVGNSSNITDYHIPIDQWSIVK
ncbi:MAG: heparinase II/III family protein [Clostridia bacterium]|nr:heparinase II/III family protein [Clostridia bacterium]